MQRAEKRSGEERDKDLAGCGGRASRMMGWQGTRRQGRRFQTNASRGIYKMADTAVLNPPSPPIAFHVVERGEVDY